MLNKFSERLSKKVGHSLFRQLFLVHLLFIKNFLYLILEENGIVIRHVVDERPVRVEYLLTKKGTELGKILGPISQWGESWFSE